MRASPSQPADRRAGRDTILRGRDPELNVIGESLGSTAEGHGGVLLVVGPPGIGKSSLLAEAVTMAARVGVRALSGQAFESQQAVPSIS